MSNSIKDSIVKLTDSIMAASKSSMPKQDDRPHKEMSRNIAGMLVMNDYDAAKAASLIDARCAGTLFDNNFLDKAGSMTLQSMWQGHERLAADALFSSAPGLGTPNAAAGAGELFLLMSSTTVTKPAKGDISFIDGKNIKQMIELKAGGKIGSNVQYQDVNQQVLRVCESLGVDGSLPAISSKKNSGKKQFLPNNASCQQLIVSLPVASRIMIWQAWWDSQQLGTPFPTLNSYTWSEIMWEWVKAVVNDALSGIDAFLIIKKDGNFIVWRSATDAINYYKTTGTEPIFEFRAAQANSPAFYVPS